MVVILQSSTALVDNIPLLVNFGTYLNLFQFYAIYKVVICQFATKMSGFFCSPMLISS